MIISKKLPPKALTTSLQIISRMRCDMTGIWSSSRMRLFWILGKTFLRMIFSMTRGTAMMMRGFTSAKAWAMMAGEGMRLR